MAERLPFDNLQISSLWAGTPVYILSETQDHAWLMILTPDFIGWVKSKGIARTDAKFVDTWKNAARTHLAAITHTQTSIVNQQGVFKFYGYVGSVYPLASTLHQTSTIMIPSANAQQQAIIEYAQIPSQQMALMPLIATPHQFVNLMNTLIGRPYGWGNMYFYNDCSAELKNLFAAFGIWLPRHSSDQVSVGQLIDKTTSSPEERLNYLLENGHRFMTLIYIGGHVVLYIGNYPNPNSKNHEMMAMTYQNIWGLRSTNQGSRAVIGRSALFPFLLSYPESSYLNSQVNKKYFQVSYLDAPINYLDMIKQVDLKSLMYP